MILCKIAEIGGLTKTLIAPQWQKIETSALRTSKKNNFSYRMYVGCSMGCQPQKHNLLKFFSHLVSFVELSMLIILVEKNSMIARLLFEILPKYRQNLPKTSNQGFRYFRYRIVYNRENLTYSYIKMIGMKSSTTYTVLKSIDHHHH